MGVTQDQVTACLVTRGNVDLEKIIDSLIFDKVIVWDNSLRGDFKTYGRYKACELAETEVVYFQDDDTVIHPRAQQALLGLYEDGVYLSNMPKRWHRHDYPEATWAGWGSLTNRRLPEDAFQRWEAVGHDRRDEWFQLVGCDVVFSLLTPTKRAALGQRHLPYAFGWDRAYRTPGFMQAKRRFYDRALALRS